MLHSLIFFLKDNSFSVTASQSCFQCSKTSKRIPSSIPGRCWVVSRDRNSKVLNQQACISAWATTIFWTRNNCCGQHWFKRHSKASSLKLNTAQWQGCCNKCRPSIRKDTSSRWCRGGTSQEELLCANVRQLLDLLIFTKMGWEPWTLLVKQQDSTYNTCSFAKLRF